MVFNLTPEQLLEQYADMVLNLTPHQLLAQAVTVIIIIVLSIGGQQKTQEEFVFMQIIAVALSSLQYALLSATTAAFLCVFCALRNVVFYLYKRQNKQIPTWILLTVFAVIAIIGWYSWQNPLSILPILSTFLYSYALWQKELEYLISPASCY